MSRRKPRNGYSGLQENRWGKAEPDAEAQEESRRSQKGYERPSLDGLGFLFS